MERVPAPPERIDDAVQVLRAHNTAQGLLIDPQTNTINWWGERLDLDWAVTGLMEHLNP